MSGPENHGNTTGGAQEHNSGHTFTSNPTAFRPETPTPAREYGDYSGSPDLGQSAQSTQQLAQQQIEPMQMEMRKMQEDIEGLDGEVRRIQENAERLLRDCTERIGGFRRQLRDYRGT